MSLAVGETHGLEFVHFLFSTTPAPPRHPSSSEEGSR
jgi:hypothetical protein